jgi:hypothetical protein
MLSYLKLDSKYKRFMAYIYCYEIIPTPSGVQVTPSNLAPPFLNRKIIILLHVKIGEYSPRNCYVHRASRPGRAVDEVRQSFVVLAPARVLTGAALEALTGSGSGSPIRIMLNKISPISALDLQPAPVGCIGAQPSPRPASPPCRIDGGSIRAVLVWLTSERRRAAGTLPLYQCDCPAVTTAKRFLCD